MPPALRSRILACFLLLAAAPLAVGRETASEEKDVFSGLKLRNIGPAAGGRVCRVCGVQGDPRVFYAATAAGGVWKSSDGGDHWACLTDEQPLCSAGSIAVAPSNPNIVYVGAGEANIRGNVVAGDGIWKSTDAGRTWKHVWKQKGQIGALVVHPQNAEVAFAAVLGHVSGPNSERGVYRTLDGGKTWERVLYKDADTGASDVCFDPSNPTILFAGLWQTRRRPWELTSGGPGSGLYVSRDSGETWEQLGPGIMKANNARKRAAGKSGEGKSDEAASETGLPPGPWGKVGVAVAPSDSDRVYALIEAEKGGLYRSDDGGKSWKLMSGDRKLRQRAWYYSTITVDPVNPDLAYFPQVQMLRSVDGGRTIETMRGMYHGDNHDLWIDPQDPRRMILANDGGVNLTVNGGKTWKAPPLPISQFYRIAADGRMPYFVMGTMQDLGTAAGPSDSLNVVGIRLCDWSNVGGGETGYVLPDRADPNFVYAGEYGGIITRFDWRTRTARQISSYPDNPSGHGGAEMKYRFRWPAPIAGSPHDPKVVYHAANVLFRSRDGGQSWEKLSGDLTRDDKSKQQWSGGPITGDNTTAEFYCTISAVAESPKQKGLLWAGSDDGLLHLSKDGGKSWTNLTEKLPKFPEWATVKMIEASPHDAGVAYVVIEAHLLDDDRPYLFKTTDYGATWDTLSDDLPQDDYLNVVREDPQSKGLLFLGSSRTLRFSQDGGETWRPLALNLPAVPVTDLIVKEGDLVVGTSGRSLWILDDLTPLRLLTKARVEASALLPALPAVRWNVHGPVTGHEPHAFPNPPRGAVLHYLLAKNAKEVRMEIRDSRDQLVARIKASQVGNDEKDDDEDDDEDPDAAEKKKQKEHELPTSAGLHRVVWPMTLEGAQAIKKAVADMGSPEAGPRAVPGSYTAKLIVDGKEHTTPLVIKPDPRRPIDAAALAAQEEFVLGLRGELNQLTRTVEKLRLLKQQLDARSKLLAAEPEAKNLLEKSAEFAKKLDALEEKLHNPKAKIPYDVLAQKGGAKLYSRLILLYNAALDPDGAPTQGMKEVHADLKHGLDDALAEWKSLVKEDLPKLNRLARNKWPILIVPRLKEEEKQP